MTTGVTASTAVGGGRMRTSTRMLTTSFVESEMRTMTGLMETSMVDDSEENKDDGKTEDNGYHSLGGE